MQTQTILVCLGLFSDYRNQNSFRPMTGCTHRRVQEDIMGFHSCFSCNTASDCFGKSQVAGTSSNVRLTSQLLTCVV